MKRNTLVSAVVLILAACAVLAPAGDAVAKPRKATHAVKRSRTFSFYARVVRANAHGLLVRTRRGRVLAFSASQISRRRSPARKQAARHNRRHHRHRKHSLRHASDVSARGPVTVNIVGLQPGVTVLITETVAPDGSVTITITLPPASTAGEQKASGVVSGVDGDAFELNSGDDSDLRFHMSEHALSNLNLETCSTVEVTYHQDAGMLIADGVQITGSSSSGDCAPTYDATGSISSVSDASLSLNTDHGQMTFSVASSDITDCFQPGDVVDVTYTQNSDGSLNATDVQYVEQDATGTVTAVSSKSVTITDSDTGQPETFSADPNQGVQMYTYAFDGVKVGDQIEVTYHQSGAGLTADTVNDQSGGATD